MLRTDENRINLICNCHKGFDSFAMWVGDAQNRRVTKQRDVMLYYIYIDMQRKYNTKKYYF